MTWTKNKPTQDGFYWLRRAHLSDTIVKVYDSSAGLIDFGAMVSRLGTDCDLSLYNAPSSYWWSGPIQPPDTVAAPAEQHPSESK